MSFSINTNVASLQAQNYLRVNSDFQGKTISRVTSGLRIVASGDDAAGLAIANGFRSDQAVLSQGVRNANDGLSQLQIIDGGLGNISQLLDRARTLATQSASGAFTGDRNVLNQEFSSVVGEIDRQAQAIGLNQNGAFAKSLSVFIGGGKGTSNSAVIANGSVTVDLTRATVDSKSLGLAGLQAVGNPNSGSPVDLGNGSSTSVSKILGNAANVATETIAGNTVFNFSGPGFSDPATGGAPTRISVNLNGVTDVNTLVGALNSAIQTAGNGNSPQATAFKNANITASVVTDVNGRQQLAFNSSNTAFQVQAGDQVANALLGNYSNPVTAAGQSALATATAAGAFAAPAANQTVVLRFQGLGQAAPIDLSGLSVLTTDTLASAEQTINTAIQGNATLKALGIKATDNGTNLVFSSPAGSSFEVQVANDKSNSLGFGSFQSGGATFDTTGLVAAGASTATTQGLQIGVGSQAIDLGVVAGSATEATAIANINAKLDALTGAQSQAIKAAGIRASDDGTGHIQLASANGTKFRVNLYGGTGNAFGFGASPAGAAVAASDTAASQYAAVSSVNSGGAQQSVQHSDSKAYTFSGLRTAGENQTVGISGVDANGGQHSLNVNLTTANAGSLDSAIATINQQLQQSNDGTLQNIYAVKEQNGASGAEGIRFLSSKKFEISLGSAAGGEGLVDGSAGATPQGALLASGTSNGGAVADISNQSTAQVAVTTLSLAITTLGTAQAVVGRGQNQFGYAINLAQSQLSNLATAESRIRDADLAAEAANLTKAQILLQAGVAALAQANTAPQAVLSLLRG